MRLDPDAIVIGPSARIALDNRPASRAPRPLVYVVQHDHGGGLDSRQSVLSPTELDALTLRELEDCFASEPLTTGQRAQDGDYFPSHDRYQRWASGLADQIIGHAEERHGVDVRSRFPGVVVIEGDPKTEGLLPLVASNGALILQRHFLEVARALGRASPVTVTSLGSNVTTIGIDR